MIRRLVDFALQNRFHFSKSAALKFASTGFLNEGAN
jgi:hypothetical protein